MDYRDEEDKKLSEDAVEANGNSEDEEILEKTEGGGSEENADDYPADDEDDYPEDDEDDDYPEDEDDEDDYPEDDEDDDYPEDDDDDDYPEDDEDDDYTDDDEDDNYTGDDGELVETDLEEDSDYIYEPVEAEIYKIIPEDDGYGEEDEPDGEEESQDVKKAEILDFSRAAVEENEDNGEKKRKSRLKSFIKKHIRDIILGTVVIGIFAAAVIAGLYIRQREEKNEAEKLRKRGGSFYPPVEFATPGDAKKERTDIPATPDAAEKESK